MPKHDHSDPWMNQSREPMTASERALRPSGPSNRVLFLLAVVVMLALALSAFFGWSSWRGARAPHGAPVAPPQGNTAPAPPPGKEVRRPELQHPAPRVQHFAKCVSRTGAATYSDGACPAGTEASTVSVKPDTNLADGMSPEARAASIRRNSVAAQDVIEHERRVAVNGDAFVAECSYLSSQIAAIDAAARQPLPGYEQDRLKDQRRRARDRQFALRCG